MGRFTGILGLLTMLGFAYAFSTNRRAIRLKTVAWGLGLQFVFAVFVLRIDAGRSVFQKAGDAVTRLLQLRLRRLAVCLWRPGQAGIATRIISPFRCLPTVIFIAAFFAVLYHFGIMQIIIKIAAWVMTRVMGASGAESLNVAASIFMGQTEAPLTIRPFLPDLTRSELMTVMTSGMAHVSGGIMAAYIAFGIEPKHLLSAVIMTAPGTLLMAKMLVPETEQPKTAGRVVMSAEEEKTEKEENLLGAIARGTTDGLHLALNIAAMLISFLALIALANGIIGGIHNHIGWFPASLEQIFGVIFAPIAWVIGIPWHDCRIDRQPARHAHGAERTGRILHARDRRKRRSIRARSRLRRLRCAASRISARSEFRSAASARSRRTRGANWRGSAFARCWPERWPT